MVKNLLKFSVKDLVKKFVVGGVEKTIEDNISAAKDALKSKVLGSFTRD